jgi:integrative and conjugative element protein (TIGR02256 family)
MIKRLVLAQRGRAQVDAEVLAHPEVETGGLLPARVIGDALIVPFTIAAGPKAMRARARFSPDTAWQQLLLDHAFDNFACTFGGAWHRHPGHFSVPSHIDHKTARHIVTDAEWDTEQAVFPIAIVRDQRVCLRAFLMHRDAPDFVEVPIEIVPNNNPLVLEALGGAAVTTKEV